MSDEQISGSELYWDCEDCPRDGCKGELQQQDRYNVMCLDCEEVFAHYRDESTHYLVDENSDTVTEKSAQ